MSRLAEIRERAKPLAEGGDYTFIPDDQLYLLDLIDQQSEAINRAWNVLEDYIDETSHIGIPEKHDIGKARSILASVIDEVGE